MPVADHLSKSRYKIVVQTTLGQMKDQGIRVVRPRRYQSSRCLVTSRVFLTHCPSVRVLCCLVVWFQASRCLWDPSTDNYASAQYTNATIFCRYTTTTTTHAHAPNLNAPHSSVSHVPHVNAFAFLVSFFFFFSSQRAGVRIVHGLTSLPGMGHGARAAAVWV